MTIQLSPNFAAPFSSVARLSFAFASGAMLSLAPGLTEAALAEAGLSLSSSGDISERLEIQQQRIINSGVSSFLAPVDAAGRFISDSTPPAPGQRVTLYNITPGFSSEPFTQRDYSNANGSELITFGPGTEHETRRFVVLPGSSTAPKQNDFRYDIHDARGNLLESGEFSVAIALSSIPVTTVATNRGFGKGLGHHDSFGFHGRRSFFGHSRFGRGRRFGGFRSGRRFRGRRFRGGFRRGRRF